MDSGNVYALLLSSGVSAQGVKIALPNGGGFDANSNPVPSTTIADASIVLNITQVQGLDNATFMYGNYGGDSMLTTDLNPMPRVGTLLVVPGQRVRVIVSRDASCCASNEGSVSVQVELMGDFCKRAPDQTLCKGHSDKASGNGTASQANGNATSAPVATSAATKSASARRVVLSVIVACLALGATVL